MKISVSSAPLVGKEEYVKAFCEAFPSYTAIDLSLDTFDIRNISIFDKENIDKIWLDLTKQITLYNRSDNIIYIGSPIEALAQLLWLCEKNPNAVPSDYIQSHIIVTRELLRTLDIVFLLPFSKFNMNEDLQTAGPASISYIQEIDNIIQGMYALYKSRKFFPFFPENDCPGLIEIFGNIHEKIHLTRMYIDENGDLIGGDVNKDILNLSMADDMMKLIEDQKVLVDQEQKEQKIITKFKKKHLKMK